MTHDTAFRALDVQVLTALHSAYFVFFVMPKTPAPCLMALVLFHESRDTGNHREFADIGTETRPEAIIGAGTGDSEEVVEEVADHV